MMDKTPNPDDVVVSHYSEYENSVVYQLMSYQNAKEHWKRLSEAQKSAYTIRHSEPDDEEEKWPKIVKCREETQ